MSTASFSSMAELLVGRPADGTASTMNLATATPSVAPEAAASPIVALDGSSSGLGAVNVVRMIPSRVTPGIGTETVTELLDRMSLAITFTVDANNHTCIMFSYRSGSYFKFRWRPEGSASGKPQFLFEGPCTVTMRAPAGGVRRYDIVCRAVELNTADQ